ncbi:MAG: hypothetical protein WB799_14145 [Candidatus Sulfotelmatobacter sp.]
MLDHRDPFYNRDPPLSKCPQLIMNVFDDMVQILGSKCSCGILLLLHREARVRAV